MEKGHNDYRTMVEVNSKWKEKNISMPCFSFASLQNATKMEVKCIESERAMPLSYHIPLEDKVFKSFSISSSYPKS